MSTMEMIGDKEESTSGRLMEIEEGDNEGDREGDNEGDREGDNEGNRERMERWGKSVEEKRNEENYITKEEPNIML